MKGYFIDATEREIREVEYEGLKDLQRFVGGNIDTALVWQNGDVCFVDDEGIYKPYMHFFRLLDRGDDQPLAGNGIVVGREVLDRDGELVRTNPPAMTIAMLHKRIVWMSRAEVDAWVKENANRPSSAIYFAGKDGEMVQEVIATVEQTFGGMPRPTQGPEPIGYLMETSTYQHLNELRLYLHNLTRTLTFYEQRDYAETLRLALEQCRPYTD